MPKYTVQSRAMPVSGVGMSRIATGPAGIARLKPPSPFTGPILVVRVPVITETFMLPEPSW